jgi:hypothetical protein
MLAAFIAGVAGMKAEGMLFAALQGGSRDRCASRHGQRQATYVSASDTTARARFELVESKQIVSRGKSPAFELRALERSTDEFHESEFHEFELHHRNFAI